MKYLKDIPAILKRTAAAWYAADPFRQSAIIAYYALFSIPPLLVIIITLAGFAFGQEAVQGEVSKQISAAMDDDTARQVEGMIAYAGARDSSVWAAAIGIITLIFGATGVFVQLQTSLNQIWEVQIKAKKEWLQTIKDRIFSFGLILSIGFLLLVSLVLSAALAGLGDWIKLNFPDLMLYVLHLLNFILSLAIISVLFALMFRILPGVRIRWSCVWTGAIVTALLFTLGKSALGFYFGKADPASGYGAAGSVVLLMLWVSYSCMIVFFGAEYTRQFTIYYDYKIQAGKNAVFIQKGENPERKKKDEAVKKVASEEKKA